jgi:general transcription factor 3C polypeptide 5 (transcription factor C subunit 1)
MTQYTILLLTSTLYRPSSWPILTGRYQSIYFYMIVNRGTTSILRAQSVESAEEEEEVDGKKDRGWWAAEQERRIAAGERAPIDRT